MPVKEGLSGSSLKIIALVSMFVDHVYYAVFQLGYIEKRGFLPGLYLPDGTFNPGHWVFGLEVIMRAVVGRVAFPIFCFLLVEGFVHTSNRTKYKMRLFLFALLSEIPFNLAFRDSLKFGTSNVFFTLFLALLALDGLESSLHPVLRTLLVFVPAYLAQVLGSDYGASGVLLVVGLYLARGEKAWAVLVGLLSVVVFPAISLMSLLAYAPICLYNGKRGLNLKYVFYAFYPVHLAGLYLVRLLIVR